jgi:hypothetical protein
MMSIYRFLDWEKPTWAISPKFTSVVFLEVGQLDCYKYLFIGKRCPLAFSLQREVMPDKFKYIPDIGELMGVLMDMSVQFNLYKVSVEIDEYEICKYMVWISKVESGQERNIDADLVERFSKKVCGE